MFFRYTIIPLIDKTKALVTVITKAFFEIQNAIARIRFQSKIIVSYRPTKGKHNGCAKTKAVEIAAKSKLTCQGGMWLVPSQSGPTEYTVDPDPQTPSCSCPDFEARQLRCKHIYAVEITLKREIVNDGQTQTVTETVTVKKKYTQECTAYNQAQQTEKSHFLAFLYELCSKVEEPIQVMGRPRIALRDMLFAVTYRTYTMMSARRFASDMRDALAKGYVSKAPSFNSVFTYSQMESLTPYLKYLIAESAKPLQSIETDFAVDASGFSTCTYVRWFDAKYGKTESWHDWVKMHVVCGIKTHIVTGVEITRATKHESPLYPDLLKQTAKAFCANAPFSAKPSLAALQ